jgi:catechol 2,3-dioxygenase-like lactoylglutathione lyase family enzyme
MSVELNHTILWSRDRDTAAAHLTDVLGLPAAIVTGPFRAVGVGNHVTLDIGQAGQEHVGPQHYAFLVTDDDFDRIFGRLRARGLPYFAYPGHRDAGQINRRGGGRGVYWDSVPDGHQLEILTEHGDTDV